MAVVIDFLKDPDKIPSSPPEKNFFKNTFEKISTIIFTFVEQVSSFFKRCFSTPKSYDPSSYPYTAKNLTKEIKEKYFASTTSPSAKTTQSSIHPSSSSFDLDNIPKEEEQTLTEEGDIPDTVPYKPLKDWSSQFSTTYIENFLKPKIEQLYHDFSTQPLTTFYQNMNPSTTDAVPEEQQEIYLFIQSMLSGLSLEKPEFKKALIQEVDAILPEFIQANKTLLQRTITSVLTHFQQKYSMQFLEVVNELLAHGQHLYEAEKSTNKSWDDEYKKQENALPSLKRRHIFAATPDFSDVCKKLKDIAEKEEIPLDALTTEEQFHTASKVVATKITAKRKCPDISLSLSSEELEAIVKDRLFAHHVIDKHGKHLDPSVQKMLKHYHQTGEKKEAKMTTVKEQLSKNLSVFLAKKVAKIKKENPLIIDNNKVLKFQGHNLLTTALKNMLQKAVEQAKGKLPLISAINEDWITSYFIPTILDWIEEQSYEYMETQIIQKVIINPLVDEFTTPAFMQRLTAFVLLPFFNDDLLFYAIIDRGYLNNPKEYAPIFTKIVSRYVSEQDKQTLSSSLKDSDGNPQTDVIALTEEEENELFDVWYQQNSNLLEEDVEPKEHIKDLQQDFHTLQISHIADTLKASLDQHLLQPLIEHCKKQETVTQSTVHTFLQTQYDVKDILDLSQETYLKPLQKLLSQQTLTATEVKTCSDIFAHLLNQNTTTAAHHIEAESPSVAKEEIFEIFKKQLSAKCDIDTLKQLFHSSIKTELSSRLLPYMHILLQTFVDSTSDHICTTIVEEQLKENTQLQTNFFALRSPNTSSSSSHKVPIDFSPILQIGILDIAMNTKAMKKSWAASLFTSSWNPIRNKIIINPVNTDLQELLFPLSQNPAPLFSGIRDLLQTLLPIDDLDHLKKIISPTEDDQKELQEQKEAKKAEETELYNTKIKQQTDYLGLLLHFVIENKKKDSHIPPTPVFQEALQEVIQGLILREQAPDSTATHATFLNMVIKVQEAVVKTQFI